MDPAGSISSIKSGHENRGIARAASLVGALTLCSRVAGLVRDMVIGHAFGAGPAADAFFVAFRIPNLLRRFVAEGAMGAAFVPVFTEYLSRQRPGEAVVAARVLATGLALLLAAITLLGVLLAPVWVGLFAPGFSADPERLRLTVRLTQLLFPYILLAGLVALLAGLLNSLRHFTTPALSPVLLNLSIIAAALLLCPALQTPVRGLAYGVLFGGLLQLASQGVALARLRVFLLPLWRPRHPVLARVARLMVPTLVGTAVYQFNILIGTILASLLPPGSVSFLWYADRVFEFPLGIFAVALGTAALPTFAGQAARRALTEMRDSLTFTLNLANWVALPATAGLLVLATPITIVLFQRGAFSLAEAQSTAWALQAFAVGLWPVSIARLLVPAFYALGDTRTPVVAAALSVVANVVLSLVFMGPIGIQEGPILAALGAATRGLCLWDLRHAGLALATSLAAAVNVAVLWIALSRRLGGLGARRLLGSFGRCVVASLVMAPVVGAVAGAIEWGVPGRAWTEVAVLSGAIGTGVLVFAAAAWVMGAREMSAFLPGKPQPGRGPSGGRTPDEKSD